jgi:hypothetical protein
MSADWWNPSPNERLSIKYGEEHADDREVN